MRALNVVRWIHSTSLTLLSAGVTTVKIALCRKSFRKTSPFSGFLIPISEDDGSLSRPPMRLFGRPRGQHSVIYEEESVDPRSAESDDDVQLGGESESESDEDVAW